MSKASKESTYNRIINASIKLFNEQGERFVTTNHIVAYLKISPGNLYYYFKNKEEIVEEVFRRYETELSDFFKENELKLEAETAFKFVLALFEIMWRYRFLLTDTNTFFERTEGLKKIQNRHLQSIIPVMNEYLDSLAKTDVLNISNEDLQVLKLNFWVVFKYWYDFDKYVSGSLTASSKIRASIQILTLIKPYLNEQDKALFSQLIGKLRIK